MRTPFSRHSRLKACGLALLLTGVAGVAADTPTMPKGSTREQMLRQLGEPRSQIVAGDRVIVFYARERYVLRNDVIVDFEPIAAEPIRRPPPVAPAPAAEPAAAPAAATDARESAPVPAPAPATVGVRRTGEPVTATSAPAAAAAPLRNAPAPEPVAPAPVVPVEPRLEIKRVLPRTAAPSPVRAASAQATETPAAPAPATATAPAPGAAATGPGALAKPAEPAPAVAAPTGGAPAPSGAPAMALPSLDASPAVAPAATDEVSPTEPIFDPVKDAAAAAAAAEKKAKVRSAVQRRIEAIGDAPLPDPTVAIWSGKNFVIVFVIVAGGLGYLVWRRRQHQLAMAATAVSHAPFETTTVNDIASGAVFSADMIGRLDPRRFEDLVIAYYCKTGVVAVRADESPGSPVHVKISWKGEKRPFACVHCIAQPEGLVPAAPLQQLFDVINAEGIRRGYVVTSGKFHVTARDFAEEKHLTILHGDLFIEKLNALPGPARNEIMQVISGSAPAAAPAV